MEGGDQGRRVRRFFDAALVGGPRHRDYLVDLGMPADRIALGYNAVDNAFYADARPSRWRRPPEGRHGLPAAPYFLAVSRFVPEKNLPRLVEAFAALSQTSPTAGRWDLVLCGDGPGAAEVEAAVAASGHGRGRSTGPGFLQADELVALVRLSRRHSSTRASRSRGAWSSTRRRRCGLAAARLRPGRVRETLVPEPDGTTGTRFDPRDVEDADRGSLTWMASLPEARAAGHGPSARPRSSHQWGPERFAQGTLRSACDRARRAAAGDTQGLETIEAHDTEQRNEMTR